MTKRTQRVPTAAQRVAQRLRAARTAGGWDQATVAELLTALGSPTKPSTITRIESGAQPATIEQLLLLALFLSRDALRSVLSPPFTIGTLTVRDAADLDSLLLGYHADELGELVTTGLDGQADRRVSGFWDDRRHKMLAQSLSTTPAKVTAAAHKLYGHGADREISTRFQARLKKVSPQPEPESASWRAYRSHAVRAVTREIGDAL